MLFIVSWWWSLLGELPVDPSLAKEYTIGALVVICLGMVLQFLRTQQHRPTAANGNGGTGKSGDKNADWWKSTIAELVKDCVDDRVMPTLNDIDARQRQIEMKLEVLLNRMK